MIYNLGRLPTVPVGHFKAKCECQQTNKNKQKSSLDITILNEKQNKLTFKKIYQ